MMADIQPIIEAVNKAIDDALLADSLEDAKLLEAVRAEAAAMLQAALAQDEAEDAAELSDLKDEIADLNDDIDALGAVINARTSEIAVLKAEIAALKAQIPPPVVVPPVVVPPVAVPPVVVPPVVTPPVTGNPQFPDLLKAYPFRPAWQVAGVDYPVGVRSGVTLKKPTASNLPAGAALGTGNLAGTLYINGKDVKLSGFDISGYTVYINDTATGTATIEDCGGTKCSIRSVVQSKAGLIVRYCSIDAGGTASSPDFHIIKVWTKPLTVENSWIRNGAAGIQCPEPLTLRNNLLHGFAWVAGAHAAAIAVQGTGDSTATALVEFNTVFCGEGRNSAGYPVGIGTGIACYNDAGGSLYNVTFSKNVIIANYPGGSSYLTGFYIDTPGSASNMVVKDCYFASVNGYNKSGSGAFGAIYKNSKGNVSATYSGNIDMTTGTAMN